MPAARSAAPIENSTALPRPPPTSATVVSAWISVGVPVGPISTTGSPGLQQRAQVGTAAHLQHDHRHQATLRIGPGAGHRQALHRQHGRGPTRFGQPRGQHLVVLQPVELARAEGARGGRGTQHHLDDGRRQPVHRVHRAPQARPGSARSARRRRPASPAAPAKRARHHGIAALRAAHRLHHVAEEARVQVAEEADEAAVGGAVHQHLRPHPAWRGRAPGGPGRRPRPPPGSSGRRA